MNGMEMGESAVLSGANLTNANLAYANLENATFCQTTMPYGSINNSGCGAVATTVPSTPTPTLQP